MKVVCIILLFGIAAANLSATNKADSSKDGKDTNGKRKLLNFPSFIPDPTKFASELLDICKKNKTSLTLNYTAINDKHVDFKNCTFLCKYTHVNVTKRLPENTPCGPNNQTCAKPEECVGGLPGC
uniref:Putative secreted salivary protein salp15 iper-2 n=1 Tax=Ixodes ricinus TaxID=34613 RepID=V5ID22_IXORI